MGGDYHVVVLHDSPFADSFDPAGPLPFLGDVLGHGERVALQVRFAVVNDSPPVAYSYFDLFVCHFVFVSKDHQLVGNPETKLIAPGLGTASASLVSEMNW
jgi:hypothetical protein